LEEKPIAKIGNSMKLRDNVKVEGVPFVWSTNLRDEEIRQFYILHQERLNEQVSPRDPSSSTIVIPLRMGFLEFRDGFCVWTANNDKHTVLYRTNTEWELWNARQTEIAELRQEQAIGEAVEKRIAETEDDHLREKTEVALAANDCNVAAAYINARAELRQKFCSLKGMSVGWNYWSPDLIFARFPLSAYGVDFLRRYRPIPQAFINFAHWFGGRKSLGNHERIKQTTAIYTEALKLFPNNASLTAALCLFYRRVGMYDEAIAVCKHAAQKGLKDGTKSGFEGRLKRLQKEKAKKG
jgi:hypothetical protein